MSRVVFNNEDTFSTEPSDIECPYCGIYNDVTSYEESIYQDDDGFDVPCWSCSGNMIVVPSISWSWTAYQEDKDHVD